MAGIVAIFNLRSWIFDLGSGAESPVRRWDRSKIENPRSKVDITVLRGGGSVALAGQFAGFQFERFQPLEHLRFRVVNLTHGPGSGKWKPA